MLRGEAISKVKFDFFVLRVFKCVCTYVGVY